MKTIVTIILSSLFLVPFTFSPLKVRNSGAEINISEEETKKFTEDPITYIKTNFNIKEHKTFHESKGAPEYQVSFRCVKGYLTAKYDTNGELLSTKIRFKNVTLPRDIMSEIYRDYKGWEVVDINYKAVGKGEIIKTARYNITLKKADQKVVVKKKIMSKIDS